MTDHDHSQDNCPLCPTPAVLAAMGERNRARREDERRALLEAIEADPSSFVHVIEGYTDTSDREPVIMLIAATLEKARSYCASLLNHGEAIFEITPYKIDEPKTGNVVLYHSMMEDGRRVEGEGRFHRTHP